MSAGIVLPPQDHNKFNETLNAPLSEWNKGIFDCEIRKLLAVVQANGKASRSARRTARALPDHFQHGTANGTKAALTQLIDAFSQRVGSFYDVMNYEPSLPVPLSLAEKRSLFTWSNRAEDQFPPHLKHIPDDHVTPIEDIFQADRLANVKLVIANMIPPELEETAPSTGASIAEIWSKSKDIFDSETIAEREDWYSDAVFAQQFFTGTDPTIVSSATLPRAGAGGSTWLDEFKKAAKAQESPALSVLEKAGNTFLVVDYSDIRTALGIPEAPLMVQDIGTEFPPTRYCSAPVALFLLSEKGVLHPLAIVVDYKKNSILDSLTVFNKRLEPSYPMVDTLEEKDWGWRYAKTAVQVASWLRHEVSSHLCETHLVEEVVIVAAHRSFPDTSPIFQLLSPHWLKTLSLNQSARTLLVPAVVVPIAGLPAAEVVKYLNYNFDNFNWTGRYIPQDLKNRGFPEEKLKDAQYNNYVYGKDIFVMWEILRGFVKEYIDAFPQYRTDELIRQDKEIATWVKEMSDPKMGAIKTFPNIQTRDQLIDALTMCISIASPQHSAVNYLQQYYQSFVLNKPTAFYSPIPSNLEELHDMTEVQLMKALPVGRTRDWLLAAHVPYLLSYRVAQEQTIMNYALSLYRTSTGKVKEAAENLVTNLRDAKELFKQYSELMTDQTTPYSVLDPDATAVSILI